MTEVQVIFPANNRVKFSETVSLKCTGIFYLVSEVYYCPTSLTPTPCIMNASRMHHFPKREKDVRTQTWVSRYHGAIDILTDNAICNEISVKTQRFEQMSTFFSGP
jgi:hypothetical protein